LVETPESALELLKQDLAENYLIPEGQARRPENGHEPERLAGTSIDEFLPAEILRARK